MDHRNKISVSVIIPAYNCEGTIALTLKAFAQQTYGASVEVIVVDDGSKDQTRSVVEKFANVKYFYQDNAGPAAARNRGVNESKGDVILFTDSDCIPYANWIEVMVSSLLGLKVSVISGSYDIFNKGNILARSIFDEINYRHQRLMPDYPKSFGSYNFCAWKKAFLEVGGFNEEYKFASGEDNDLSYKFLRAGHNIFFERKSKVMHIFPTNIFRYLKEQYRHGFWRAKMYTDHPQMSRGDDYTFWKDIAEPPLVMAIVLTGVIALFNGPGSAQTFSALVVVLASIEFLYGFLIEKNFLGFLFLSLVMFLRSFARTIGFLSGASVFLFAKK